MIPLRTAIPLLLCLALVLQVNCSGLSLSNIDQLLEQDWSVIQDVVAQSAASDPSQVLVGVEPKRLERSSEEGTDQARNRQRDISVASSSSTSLTIRHPLLVAEKHTGLQRLPVQVPRLLHPLQPEARRLELESLSNIARTDNPRFWKYRRVMPLSKLNMDPEAYRAFHEKYLHDPQRQRFLWTTSGRTYTFYKPIKRKDALEELFGSRLGRYEEAWAVWRLERYGDAKIWRLLGLVELPSYYAAKKFVQNQMERIPSPYWTPVYYLNDAAHLDYSQVASS